MIMKCESVMLMLAITFGAVAQTGTILREYWYGISGNTVSSLTSNANYPDNPSGSSMLTAYFEAPVNWNDSYGTRIRGYIHPPVSGNYLFWISGDDHCELWLSTDDKQSHKQLIATVPGYTNSREWTKYPEQQSAAIFLEGGKRYYIEALHKEGSGGDHVAVGWQLPGATYERPIPTTRLSPVTDNDDYSLWSDTARVLLNTSSSGAAISGTVAHFPVLIRLNSSNFDFTKARTDGADIRFAKHDGTHLPYQIERWNAGTGVADIWVKVDSIYGNNSSQYITMLWGKSDAVSRSNSAAVFDSAYGYRGVWHLNQNPAGTSPQLSDASLAANHGTTQGAMGSGDTVSAVIDRGIKFDGINDYISTAMQYGNPGIFTMSLWFKTTTAAGGRLIGFGNQQVGQSYNYDRHVYMDTQGRIHFGIYNGNRIVLSSTQQYNNGVWHQVTARVSSSGMRLYIDGTLVASNTVNNPQNYWGYWRIGYDLVQGWPGEPSSYYWQGAIDEATVAHVERSESWIKLTYMNQKPDATFPFIETPVVKPLVELNALVAAVPESSLTTDAFTVTASLGTPAPAPVTVQVLLDYSGTALNGIDYEPLPNMVSVTIPKDSLHKTVVLSLTPVEDSDNEGNETLYVAILPDTSYRTGDQDTIFIVIIDNDQQYPPVIIAEPSNVSVLEGDVATFLIDVSGTPPFTYQWRRNGIPEGPNSASYTTPPVSRSDSGSFFDCIVSNSVGSDTSRQAFLFVAIRPEAPWIVRSPESHVAAEGDTVVFSVSVNGTPPFTYQWYCDAAAVPGEVDSVLRIGPVSLSDKGKKYYCMVSNSVSSVLSRTALLTVKRPSSHTIIITGDLMTTRNIKVGIEEETRMNFIVRLYPSVTSDSVIYTESFLDSNRQAIKVKDGRFAIHLGTGQSSGDLMGVVRQHANIFVSFSLSSIGGNFETLDRRVPLTASPYALSSLPQLLKGNVHPDSAAIQAPIGTHYVRTTTNATYIKTHRGWSALIE